MLNHHRRLRILVLRNFNTSTKQKKEQQREEGLVTDKALQRHRFFPGYSLKRSEPRFFVLGIPSSVLAKLPNPPGELRGFP